MTLICGVDEAGRGPLCGPVFASAVILDNNLKIKNLDDSKKISPKKRDEIYEEIKIKSFEYTFASASVEEIDELNILNATLLAMKRAILMLKKKPVECYIDGLYTPKIEGCNFIAMIKGKTKPRSWTRILGPQNKSIKGASGRRPPANFEALLWARKSLPKSGGEFCSILF